jgi:hypothetical protein
MEIVQTGKSWIGMRGAEKKDLVLGVISAVVEDLMNDTEVVGEDFDAGSREAILTALALAPMLIDAAVDFAKVYSETHESGNGRRRSFCCM